ncbi:MAG: dihydrodipicolinate reductase [Bradyrhizobium sp.]|nr:dihydrodipicolinate reductase [Bradyrhizobium sp.]
MAFKVIVWGTGSVGKIALREVVRSDDFELVGVKVHSDTKVGKDAGELCGEAATGIRAVREAVELPLDVADCVLYCPMVANYDEIAGLLRKGVNVVTTASNVYPRFYGAAVFDQLDEAGKAGAASFHGSGINPAFMSDVLPLTLSGLSHRARKITVREVSDVNHYASTAPEIMCDHIGFGKPPEEAMKTDDFLKGMTAYFSESIQLICDTLGVTLERIEEHHQAAVTNVPVTLENGRVIDAGTVGCRMFEWRGIVGGEARVVLSTFWKLTTDLTPGWDVSSTDLVEWIVTIEGTPSFQCRVATCASFDPASPDYLTGGEVAAVVATAVHAVNAVPYVVRSAPGVRTFLDMPIITSAGALRG